MSAVKAHFASGHLLRVLEHRIQAGLDYERWERCWIPTLMETVRAGDIVFDVGAEEGEFGALTAAIGAKVHLFEPTPSVWPNIRAVWEANGFEPGGCWPGFAYDRCWGEAAPMKGWPACSSGPLQMDSRFSHAIERPDLPAITLDRYSELMAAQADVVMMDTEGAEVRVLRGLTRWRPRVIFVSLHAPEALATHRSQPEEVHVWAANRGYAIRSLGYDHEEHLMLTRTS